MTWLTARQRVSRTADRMKSAEGLVLPGLGGLTAGVALTTVVAWAATEGVLPRIVPDGAATWALLGFALFFSLAELPLMVLALRRMTGSAPRPVMALAVAGFVFFAAFYAAPFTVLTRQVVTGVALASLCVVRLICVAFLIPQRTEKT